MGFECGLLLIPKVENLSAKQCLATCQYLNFVEWLKTSWCQQQINENNYVFKFEDYSNFTLNDLPTGIDMEKIANVKTMSNLYTKDCPNYFFFLCSIGRKFDHIIRDIIKENTDSLDKYKDYFELTKEDIVNIKKYCEEELEELTTFPVSIISGYIEKDGGIVEVDIDGVCAEILIDGSWISIPVGSRLEYSMLDIDNELKSMYESIDQAADELLNDIDLDKNYVVYFRSE